MVNRGLVNLLAAGVFAVGLTACGHDDDPPPAAPLVPSVPSATFSIGGNVTGATGALTLQNSNGTTLAVPGSGSFTFATEMVTGASYNVTVAVPPASQNCAVTNGSGTVGGADITNVAVTCINSSASARNWGTAAMLAADDDLLDFDTFRAPKVAFDAAGNALA